MDISSCYIYYCGDIVCMSRAQFLPIGYLINNFEVENPSQPPTLNCVFSKLQVFISYI